METNNSELSIASQESINLIDRVTSQLNRFEFLQGCKSTTESEDEQLEHVSKIQS
jgi:hypothetical protein